MTDENSDLIKHIPTKKAANNIDNTVKKHKNKKNIHKDSYENFTTVQEIIVNGPKVTNSNSKIAGLLSVTTV